MRHHRDDFFGRTERGAERGRGRRGDERSGFGHGRLKLILLHLIREQARHGYELIKAIEELGGGHYSPSAGAIYPTLSLLEESGLIEVQGSDGPRKAYRITEAGVAQLDEEAQVVTDLLERMRHHQAHARGSRPPQVARAIESLRMAVHLRLDRPLSDEQAHAIAAALDEATRAIERI
jgi:DNA-binding PadR family transcriptional regulator